MRVAELGGELVQPKGGGVNVGTCEARNGAAEAKLNWVVDGDLLGSGWREGIAACARYCCMCSQPDTNLHLQKVNKLNGTRCGSDPTVYDTVSSSSMIDSVAAESMLPQQRKSSRTVVCTYFTWYCRQGLDSRLPESTVITPAKFPVSGISGQHQ